MGTRIRPEISTKNSYHIGKHRYYELKHFCLQYPDWKKRYASLDLAPSHAPIQSATGNNGTISNPTAVFAEARLYFDERIRMIEKAAIGAGGEVIGALLLRSVTEEISYEHLQAQDGVPCCKEVWYAAYRRFFWLLDKARQ